MDFITTLFQNKVDKYLRVDKYVNPLTAPQSLLKSLKTTQQLKYLKKKLSTKTSNIFKLFKRMTICSLLVIYSNKYYEIIADLPLILSGNKWVDKEFIQPYHKFLKKIALSNEMFEKTKKSAPILLPTQSLDVLFYDITLLKLLFTIVNKMPLLGRYYLKDNEPVVTNFINTLAVHAQKLYISFRQILGSIIDHPKVYLPTRDHELILKGILKDELPFVNEEMKKLFLDKYFYPLGKGIGIKLFKPEEQGAENTKTIQGILNDHAQTNRQKQKYQLEITLFPQPGKVNMKFYEQTLMLSNGKMFGDQSKHYHEAVVDLDDIDVDNDSQNEESHVEDKSKINENDIQTGIERESEIVKEL